MHILPVWRTLRYGLATFAMGLNLASAAELSWKSPAQRCAVVELYTSEGCSSCPPADRWFSGLKHQAGLFRDFVPVAFHVDYWDYIGWSDRFAAPAFSARQSRYAQSNGLSQVYTPGVVLQGKEWRGWGGATVAPPTDRTIVGPLELVLDGKGQAILLWSPAAAGAQALSGNVVLLGAELTTPVRRGENAGRELHHDFVVLGLSSGPLLRRQEGFRAALPLPGLSNKAPRYAIAAWVSTAANPAPLQAVGGWLPTAWAEPRARFD
jgi:hypothetical protein